MHIVIIIVIIIINFIYRAPLWTLKDAQRIKTSSEQHSKNDNNKNL